MSTDFMPSKDELDYANKDVLERSRRFIERLDNKSVPEGASIYDNDEIECPDTIDEFEETEAGNSVLRDC